MVRTRTTSTPEGSRLLDGPSLAARGLGVDGPKTGTAPSGIPVDSVRVRRIVRVRLAVEALVAVAGVVVAYATTGASAVLVIGMLLVGLAGAVFDLVLLRRMRTLG